MESLKRPLGGASTAIVPAKRPRNEVAIAESKRGGALLPSVRARPQFEGTISHESLLRPSRARRERHP